MALYNNGYRKEKEMKNAKETTVKKRPTKKELMSKLEAKGVPTDVLKSLIRANIETIKFVDSLL